MSNQTAGASGDAEMGECAMDGDSGDGGWGEWRALTAGAYARFHEKLAANRARFPGLAVFAPVKRIESTAGTFAWAWGAAGEVQETINSVNAWGMRLHEWGAWNLVLDSYETDHDKWEVFYHFVEPVAYFCMHQPSSVADRLAVAAETLLHQANRRAFPDRPDRLVQDALQHGRTLRRSGRRKQLDRLGKHWKTFGTFQAGLDALNGSDYRNATRNFRNLSAHAFAPRLMAGQVVRAIRSIVPWEEMTVQSDGTYLPVDHPTRTGVQYAMQSMDPLPLDGARSANLAEYHKTLATSNAFAVLVDELCIHLDTLPRPVSGAK